MPVRAVRPALLTCVLAGLLIASVLSGCGLETEAANQAMARAAKHQEQAEAILAVLRNFPAEWQAIFSQPLSAEQIAGAQQLLAAREADLDTLAAELEAWNKELEPIKEMNVEEKIKEYVRLKTEAISCFKEYVSEYLRPIFVAYEGLVEQIAAGRTNAELNQVAEGITELVIESVTKLEECESAQEQADSYFVENKLGK